MLKLQVSLQSSNNCAEATTIADFAGISDIDSTKKGTNFDPLEPLFCPFSPTHKKLKRRPAAAEIPTKLNLF